MKQVILFDGVCRLCNGTVDFVVRRDPKRVFQFASLQSRVAHELLKKHGLDADDPATFETFYLIDGERMYTKSTAALRIAKRLRFPWPVLYAGIIIPRPIRDFVYLYIGKNRKKWFGVTTTCDMRREAKEQDRFLDSTE